MRDMKDDVLVGSIDEVALGREKVRRDKEGGRKGYYCFDGRCEPERGTLARMWIESQLVEGVCDVCGLDK